MGSSLEKTALLGATKRATPVGVRRGWRGHRRRWTWSCSAPMDGPRCGNQHLTLLTYRVGRVAGGRAGRTQDNCSTRSLHRIGGGSRARCSTWGRGASGRAARARSSRRHRAVAGRAGTVAASRPSSDDRRRTWAAATDAPPAPPPRRPGRAAAVGCTGPQRAAQRRREAHLAARDDGPFTAYDHDFTELAGKDDTERFETLAKLGDTTVFIGGDYVVERPIVFGGRPFLFGFTEDKPRITARAPRGEGRDRLHLRPAPGSRASTSTAGAASTRSCSSARPARRGSAATKTTPTAA